MPIKFGQKIKKRPVAERFEEKYIPEPNRGCWLWLGAPKSKRKVSYGEFYADGKKHMAHRFSYELYNGPIKDDLWVLHLCDTGMCVNPKHLMIGDHIENTRQAVERGRRPKGEVHCLAKLKNEDVLKIRNMWESGEYSVRRIAKMYGMRHFAISNIVKRVTWKHI